MLPLVSNTRPRIRLVSLAFIIYYHNDIALTKQFFVDFGLKPVPCQGQAGDEDSIFLCGYGTEPFIYIARTAAEGQSPTFGGAAYEVESRDELERASALISGASQAQPLNAPGGGEIVTLHDPAGHPVHLVYGQKKKISTSPYVEDIFINYPASSPPKTPSPKLKPGPTPVQSLGHYGLTFRKGLYHSMYEWYTFNFSFSPSEIIYHDFTPNACTMHIDLGTQLTDRSIVSMAPTTGRRAPSASLASFKVHDWEALSKGRKWLESKGYEQFWDAEKPANCDEDYTSWYDASHFVVVR
jgi:hypothetical protein